MAYPKPIAELIEELIKLPGIGPKFAQRLVNHFIRSNSEDVISLAKSLIKVKKNIKLCKKCFCYTDNDICHICGDTFRDHQFLCVVEAADDVFTIEKTKSFTGVYFVLGGAIDLINGIGPDRLRFRELLERVKKESFKEILIATNFDLKGETTANYLARLLAPFNIKITRPSQGIPMGIELTYVDSNTLYQSLKKRQEIK